MPSDHARAIGGKCRLKIDFGRNSLIQCEKVDRVSQSLKIGNDTIITAKEVRIEDNVVIGNNTIITADKLKIGQGSRIEDHCKIILSGEKSKFSIGDNCLIGNDSKIVVPVFETGDYVTLHNHFLANGSKPCMLGHNVWIGQNCILNSNDILTIGNNVGIGAYSGVFTHGFWGEAIEGCLLSKVAPVTIEDDVWIVGAYNVISPGVKVGKSAVVLTGSVVTRDVLPFTCVAGVPARDITAKVTPYKIISLDEKYQMMREFMLEFIESIADKSVRSLSNGWHITENHEEYEILFCELVDDDTFTDDSHRVVFTKKNDLILRSHNYISIFDLSTKTYTKKRTEIESRIIRFLLPYKARFLPNKANKDS
jgi:acetyltransferase-like isoleucine patch superfamily enzyme